MKKLLNAALCAIMLSCDADRTELPRPKNQEVPFQKLNGELFERVVLEVTLTRPISSSPDSTYIYVKNVSGKDLINIDFYLESCQSADADVQGCTPDYHFSSSATKTLKKDSIEIRKERQFIDFNHSNKIYITAFQSDPTKAPLLAARYLYSQIVDTIQTTTDTTIYSGSGKVFIQTDGSFFCRGTVFADQNTTPRQVRLSGNISQTNQVSVKDLTQPSNSLPVLFLGSITDKTLAATAKISKDSNEKINIILK